MPIPSPPTATATRRRRCRSGWASRSVSARRAPMNMAGMTIESSVIMRMNTHSIGLAMNQGGVPEVDESASGVLLIAPVCQRPNEYMKSVARIAKVTPATRMRLRCLRASQPAKMTATTP